MNPERPPFFRRLILTFALVGYSGSVAVMAAVWWIVEDMRSSMQQAVLATNDSQKIASFEAALQYNRQMSVVFFGLTMLFAAFFAGVGIAYLRKGPQRPMTAA